MSGVLPHNIAGPSTSQASGPFTCDNRNTVPQNTPLGLFDDSEGVYIQLSGLHRKRLLSVVRYFESAVKTSFNGKISVALKQNGDPNTRDFNPMGTKFLTDECLAKIKALSTPNRFVNFQVFIPSILYIGKIIDQVKGELENISPMDLSQTFKFNIRRQLGGNLLVRRDGNICVMPTYISHFTDEIIKYATRSLSPISNIYPVNRFDFVTSGDMQFVLGLDFRRGVSDGHRYYHRFNDRVLENLGVSEFTETRIRELEIKGKFFTLFVCAGAKLVVRDGPGNENHNRTFIQQGGVVCCDRPFRIALPKAECITNTRDLNHDPNTFGEYLRKPPHIFEYPKISRLSPLSEEERNKMNNMTHPVLFLGANHSQYNSVCWMLTVTGNNPSAFLYPPEGGRIMAIAEGEEGLQEVNDRIYYEYLHDSVVTEHRTQFKAPAGSDGEVDIKRIKTILDFGDERSYVYDLGTFVHPKNKQPTRFDQFVKLEKVIAYPEFNFIYLEKGSEPQDRNQFINVYGHQPPVPPMYPPFYWKEDDKEDLCYLPNALLTDEKHDITSIYPIKPTNANPEAQTYNFYDTRTQQQTSLCKLTKGAFVNKTHWERVPNIDSSIQFDFGNRLKDGIMYRIGVDGWIWKGTKYENCPNPGQYMTAFYKKSENQEGGIGLGQQSSGSQMRRQQTQQRPSSAGRPTAPGGQRIQQRPSNAGQPTASSRQQTPQRPSSSGRPTARSGQHQQLSGFPTAANVSHQQIPPSQQFVSPGWPPQPYAGHSSTAFYPPPLPHQYQQSGAYPPTPQYTQQFHGQQMSQSGQPSAPSVWQNTQPSHGSRSDHGSTQYHRTSVLGPHPNQSNPLIHRTIHSNTMSRSHPYHRSAQYHGGSVQPGTYHSMTGNTYPAPSTASYQTTSQSGPSHHWNVTQQQYPPIAGSGQHRQQFNAQQPYPDYTSGGLYPPGVPQQYPQSQQYQQTPQRPQQYPRPHNQFGQYSQYSTPPVRQNRPQPSSYRGSNQYKRSGSGGESGGPKRPRK